MTPVTVSDVNRYLARRFAQEKLYPEVSVSDSCYHVTIHGKSYPFSETCGDVDDIVENSYRVIRQVLLIHRFVLDSEEFGLSIDYDYYSMERMGTLTLNKIGSHTVFKRENFVFDDEMSDKQVVSNIEVTLRRLLNRSLPDQFVDFLNHSLEEATELLKKDCQDANIEVIIHSRRELKLILLNIEKIADIAPLYSFFFRKYDRIVLTPTVDDDQCCLFLTYV